MLEPMKAAPGSVPRPHHRDPWFRRHPAAALTVALALFVAVLTLRLVAGSPVDGFSMLYALPVALLASAFGLRGGALGGLGAVALIGVWAVTEHISLTVTGWTSRVVPLLLLGVLLGLAVDQARRAEMERRQLEGSALLHREAIEINDLLVQGLAAARLYFEGGDVETGRRILDDTIGQARDLVSGLIRRADMGGQTVRIAPGDQPNDRKQNR
jgi:glucose-6-phosphate-specific signal transduction histidine kinase